MTVSQGRRLTIVMVGFVLLALVLIGRLFIFQIVESAELTEFGAQRNTTSITSSPSRGIIYDRNLAILAGNGADYIIGASPSLVREPEEASYALATILNRPQVELLALLTANQTYVNISDGRVSEEVANLIRDLDFQGIQIDPVPRRIYPQGKLLCHVVGYTNFDGVGSAGLEGHYQRELAGEAASAVVSYNPLTEQPSVISREGSDLVLTIDRSVQFLVEEHLSNAIRQHGAQGGTIIVMDPRTGAILAMASTPCYNPYNFYDEDESYFLNPAISQQFEPGSVMKLITMAAAIDNGTVTPNSTYYDAGVLEVGGQFIYNWDHSGGGTTDMTTLLARSLNIGAATLALWMGTDDYYDYLTRFGFGTPTGVDVMAEAIGQVPQPGDELWTETNLAVNAFGQGMAATPLQVISAISALANNGEIMQPYFVQEIRHHDGTVEAHIPTIARRPVTAETAQILTTMAINAVAREVAEAQVEGYTIAGKTSTAQIPEGGVYHPTDIIGAFVGWLPADAPELIVLVKLDRPSSAPWGSQTAAPTFATLVDELVTLLNIPPDAVRFQEDISRMRN